MKPSLAKEVVRFASVRATQNGALQELSELEAALEGLALVGGWDARRRACPRVPASPKMYPSRTRKASKSRHYRQRHMPICRAFVQALWRTRTADPLLTMELGSGKAQICAGLRGYENPAN